MYNNSPHCIYIKPKIINLHMYGLEKLKFYYRKTTISYV
jgi:hypothetical protein